MYRIHTIGIEMIYIHIFRKHPHKLELQSGGDISNAAVQRLLDRLNKLRRKKSRVHTIMRLAIARSNANRDSFTCTIIFPFVVDTTVTGVPTLKPSSLRRCLTSAVPPTFFTVHCSPIAHIDKGIIPFLFVTRFGNTSSVRSSNG